MHKLRTCEIKTGDLAIIVTHGRQYFEIGSIVEVTTDGVAYIATHYNVAMKKMISCRVTRSQLMAIKR